MRTTDSRRLKSIALNALLCGATFFAVFFAFNRYHAGSPASFFRTREGYDFAATTAESPTEVKVGERIDLTNFKGTDGRGLTLDAPLTVAAFVDPECGACAASRDMLRDVDSMLDGTGVGYVLISATYSKPPAGFFEYTASLGMGAPAYVWDVAAGEAPPPLSSVPVPTHVLLNREGIVVRKWQGTDNDPNVRARMANQITADALKELAARIK